MFRTCNITYRHVAIVLLSILANFDPIAYAGGYQDKDFSLRFPAALSRFASYGDVAAVGGASAGSKWSSSVNPASISWLKIPTPLQILANPQYSNIFFKNDSSLHFISQTITWDSKNWGVFQPSIAKVFSNEKPTRENLDFEYKLDYAQIQWGKRINNDLTIGANINFSKGNVYYDLDYLHLLKVDLVKSAIENYGIRIGSLYRATNRLLVGIVFDYALTKSRTRYSDLLKLILKDTHVLDTTHQFIFHPGLSYEYKQDSCIYLDYLYGYFSNDTGSLKVNRLFGGIDHQIIRGFFVRFGTLTDFHGNVAWTTGLGIYPSNRFTIDVAYQYDMFPELKPDFGRSRTLTLSLRLCL